MSRVRMPRVLRALLLSLLAALLARSDRHLSPEQDDAYDDELAELTGFAESLVYEQRRARYGWHWRSAPGLGMDPIGSHAPVIRPYAPARAPPAG